MEQTSAIHLIRVGLHHLRLATAVAKWQHRRGGYFIFEQPHSAASWREPVVQEMVQSSEVVHVVLDMCMFGMSVGGGGLNRKPTGVATNSPCIAEAIARRCDGKHGHTHTLNGKPKLAQEYPEEFCKAVLSGMRKQLKADGENVYAMEVDEAEDD